MIFTNPLNRRQWIQRLTSGFTGMSVLNSAPRLMAQGQQDPHFLLLLVIPGGVDTTYLFDARPLSHTAAGLQTNHLDKNPVEPTQWRDSRGNSTLVSRLVSDLEKYRPYFSILNGVVMADNFDGHEQNINFMLTGNAFGGDWFAPFLNADGRASVDALGLGNLPFADRPTNGARSLGFSLESLKSLGGSKTSNESKVGESIEKSLIHRFATERAQALAEAGGGGGLLSIGSKEMVRGLQASPQLEKRLQSLKFGSFKGIPEYMDAAHQVFANGLSRTVLIDLPKATGINVEIDAHSVGIAQQSAAAYTPLMKALAEIFEFLIETPFRGTKQSLMDVTSIMLTSEFTRTTRQIGSKLAESGTDHNPLSNTVLLGGKGFQGNLIVGQTDLAQLTPAAKGQPVSYSSVSKAHRSLDPEMIKKMGRPFDHKSLKVIETLPEVFQRQQYLTMEHVVNTLVKAFGVTDKASYRPLAGDRALTPAMPLDRLLKT